jgi:hypothetical protein
MSRFEPVWLPDGLGGRVTQTALRHYAACPRSGFLAVKYRGVDASTAEMVRGKAVHLVHERAVRLMLENGEVTIPPEVVRDLADVVLAELPVPFAEHDACREMAWRIGSELALEPETVVAAETLFALDVPLDDGGTFEVRCRIDFAELLDNGARVHVEDLKSSKAAVTQDEIARKRSDGSLSAKAFQLVLYAVALAYGYPVREEECPRLGCIHGSLSPDADDPSCDPCPYCGGRGRVETREPFPDRGQRGQDAPPLGHAHPPRARGVPRQPPRSREPPRAVGGDGRLAGGRVGRGVRGVPRERGVPDPGAVEGSPRDDQHAGGVRGGAGGP